MRAVGLLDYFSFEARRSRLASSVLSSRTKVSRMHVMADGDSTRDARAGNIVGSIRVDAVPRAATISGRQSLLLSPLKYSLYSSSRTFPSSLTYAPYPASLLASLLVIVGASLHTPL